ncbi:MAG: amidase, partial [Acidobacteria bacterium]|nr:amidase [Acidobacteriota bacterium]
AAFCGVVGYKPSYDRISRAGVLELAASFDHVGTFTRDLAGAEIVARALCLDWREVRTAAPKRLGVLAGTYLSRASDEGRAHFEATLERLAEAGFALVRLEALEDLEEVAARHVDTMAAEAWTYHQRWLPRFRHLYHEKTLALLDRGRSVPPEGVARGRQSSFELRQRFEGLMDRHGLDLWLSPAARGPAPKGLESTGDPIMNLPWSHAGLPTLALPAGTVASGLPMGLQVAGRFGQDEVLFAASRHLEGSLP